MAAIEAWGMEPCDGPALVNHQTPGNRLRCPLLPTNAIGHAVNLESKIVQKPRPCSWQSVGGKYEERTSEGEHELLQEPVSEHSCF